MAKLGLAHDDTISCARTHILGGFTIGRYFLVENFIQLFTSNITQSWGRLSLGPIVHKSIKPWKIHSPTKEVYIKSIWLSHHFLCETFVNLVGSMKWKAILIVHTLWTDEQDCLIF
jgi:hypothetical protein